MPISYEIDTDANCVFMNYSGIATDDELVECVVKLRADPRLKSGMPALVDMRDVTSMKITTAGIRRMLAITRPSNEARGDARTAVVAVEDLSFGVARVAALIAESQGATPKIEVFRDMASARKWLGMDS